MPNSIKTKLQGEINTDELVNEQIVIQGRFDAPKPNSLATPEFSKSDSLLLRVQVLEDEYMQ